MERLHQEGTAEALLLVERFLISLSNFVAKDRAVDDVVVVHPFHFKRLLLTGLPAAPSHHSPTEDPILHENGGGLDCSLLRMLLVLAFSFSDETRFHSVELLLMLALVPAQRSRANRYPIDGDRQSTDKLHASTLTL
jgi:hypothetical protein